MSKPLLDKMLALNHDPKKVLSGELEIDPKTFSKLVEEDEVAWFIQHNGSYLLYCEKELGVDHMRACFQELIMRFTGKPLPDSVDHSASTYLV